MPTKPSVTSRATPATNAGLIAEAPVRRRAFFGWFGVGATATALASTLPATAAKGVAQRILNQGQLMLDEVTHRTFADILGDTFRVEIAAGQFVEARLTEATPLKHPQPVRADGRRAPFSLIFQAPTSQALPQQIYALEHVTLGRMEIFLVPVGREAGNLLLEAVFN